MKRMVQLFGLLLLVLLLSACGGGEAGGAYTFPVMLALPEGMTLADTGQNPLQIASGEDAVFPVVLEMGYEVRESEAYTYADGVLTVHDVRYPATVQVALAFDADAWAGLDADEIPRSGSFTFSLGIDNEVCGRTDGSTEPGTYPLGTEICLRAETIAGGRFVCWSLGAPVAKGGRPLAYTPEYTFRIGRDMRVFANFGNPDTATLLYDANGGVTADGGTYLRHDSQVDYYIYPHTLPSQGQMTREGYLLYAYNTAADGSGTEYTFGANVPVPESGTMMLYAQWMKADPDCFTYIVHNNEVQITGCTSDAAVVVLPERIDGMPVTYLRTGALDGLEQMTTLVAPPTLRIVQTRAIRNCPNFKMLYLCDSILLIPDDFCENCPEFQTLKLGAVRDPVHMTTLTATTGIKFQRLLQVKGQKKLIVIAGSSAAYGLRSQMLEELLGGEYAVVNYGNNWTTPSVVFLDIVTDFIDEGDIVLLAPEPRSAQLGDNTMNVTTWQLIEAALDCVQYVDVREYKGFFSTLSNFNAARSQMKAQTYAHHHSFVVDHRGDYSTFFPRQSDTYVKTKNSFSLSPSLITDASAARLNARTTAIRARGGEVYLSFSPVNENSLTANARQRIVQLAYERAVVSRLDAIPISSVSDYIFAGTYFYNSDLHLCTEGAQIRTKKLAEQLIAALGK